MTPLDTTTAPQSFEASLDELERVVRELESGDMPLEHALGLFARGTQLSEACRRQLEDAETRVEALVRRSGEFQPEPFEPEK